MYRPSAPLVPLAVGAAGAAGAAGFVVVCSAQHAWSAVPPAALPLAFLAAGLLGALARPDHRGVVLLESVGALHLVGFALIEWVGAHHHPGGWGVWVVLAAGDVAFLGGFLALAVVVACYPVGRAWSVPQRWFIRVAVVLTAVTIIEQTCFRSTVDIVGGAGSSSMPAPRPLPVDALPVELFAVVPALVVAAVVVLALSARGLVDAQRRALGWGRLAAFVLALMLAISPAADAVFTDAQWTAIFLPVVSTVPFLLLAGLVRYRLLRVEVYLVRTVGRGIVIGIVVAVAAGFSALFDRHGITIAGVALTVAAVLGGAPLARRLEHVADRVLAGGRVGRDQLADRLAATLAATGQRDVLERTAAMVSEALDATWVRVVPVGVDTDVAHPPAQSVELRAAGHTVGRLDCGPRRGGWGAPDIALLRRLAGSIALATRDVQMSAQLQQRVAELSASRSRLAQAEDTARRRVERDLHDGVQQQLVALLARLSVAREAVDEQSPAAVALQGAHELAQQALRDLRELVSGIHPPLLGDHGLVAAVQARAEHLPLTVIIDADPRIAGERFASEIEGAAYFVVLEALANVMKHSGSARARVVLAAVGEAGLRVAVADEGNGAACADGSGLTGLRDRVEALGGTFAVHAATGVGTTVIAEFAARGRADADTAGPPNATATRV